MRRISFLSFGAILLSVSLFLIVLYVMNGMNASIQSRIVALDPNISAYFKNSEEFLIDESSLYRSSRFDSYDLIVRTIDGQFRGVHAIGYNQQDFDFWFNKLKELKQKDKHEIDYGANLEDNEIAIGIDTARSLGLLEGDQVTLIPIETLLLSQMETPLFTKVIVKKILSTDLPEIDGNSIFFNREKSLNLFKKSLSRSSGYHLWLNDKMALSSSLEGLKKYSFERVESWKEKNSDLFFALFMEKTMIGLFLGLAGLVASSSILTVLSMIMSQKQSDIAVLKTLGLSQRKTLALFTQMGLWISLSAIALGTVIGLSVGIYVERNPLYVLPQIYYDSSIPASVDLTFTFLVFMSASLLAFLGCYLPAKATLHIQPALLLKQKN